ELKDKIREFNIPAGKIPASQSAMDDAIEALKSLGFTYIQSKESAETSSARLKKNASASEIIKAALKDLQK
ncbi:MAG: hypothetical protein Q7K21_06405, partial [Elusimicrobiota bacterium]|nr:hypothetical protein [Elusimicrobiota bacterium]